MRGLSLFRLPLSPPEFDHFKYLHPLSVLTASLANNDWFAFNNQDLLSQSWNDFGENKIVAVADHEGAETDRRHNIRLNTC